MDEFLVFVTLPGTDERTSGRFSGTVRVGRSDDCDVRLPHPLVSRRHAQLSRTDDGAVVIRDLGSSNGTIAEDTVLRDEELVVQQTATLHIGPYSIVVSTEVASDDKTLLEQPRDAGAGMAMQEADTTTGAAGPETPREPGDYPDGLSAREVEVLGLLAKRRRNSEIAEDLTISPHTVARHVSNIFNKIAAANRAEAAAYTVQHRLVHLAG